MMWTTSKVCAGNRPKSSAVKTVVEAMTAPVVCGGVICGLLSTGTGQHASPKKLGRKVAAWLGFERGVS